MWDTDKLKQAISKVDAASAGRVLKELPEWGSPAPGASAALFIPKLKNRRKKGDRPALETEAG
jgi:hypothetical protein